MNAFFGCNAECFIVMRVEVRCTVRVSLIGMIITLLITTNVMIVMLNLI